LSAFTTDAGSSFATKARTKTAGPGTVWSLRAAPSDHAPARPDSPPRSSLTSSGNPSCRSRRPSVKRSGFFPTEATPASTPDASSMRLSVTFRRVIEGRPLLAAMTAATEERK
jgi:hypothetical protein